MSSDASLVIEGGGMRGFFTAGILSVLREEGVCFPCVVGMSSGALNAAAFLAGKLDLDFTRLSASPLALLNPRGLFHPREGLLKTDEFIDVMAGGCWEGVMESASQLSIGATDALTGQLTWWDKGDFAAGPDALGTRLVASCSIPVAMPQARVEGRVCADGGICESIPLARAVQAGYDRHVLILTRPRGYVKGTQHLELYLRAWLRPYPALKRAMLDRHIRYNESARNAEALEDTGKAFVFRLDEVNLGRFEYSPKKFQRIYEDGRSLARRRLPELLDFIANDHVTKSNASG